MTVNKIRCKVVLYALGTDIDKIFRYGDEDMWRMTKSKYITVNVYQNKEYIDYNPSRPFGWYGTFNLVRYIVMFYRNVRILPYYDLVNIGGYPPSTKNSHLKFIPKRHV
jgi:hypothetical protein